ncbi:polyprenyl synthetase family protein [Streptomyces sp. NPDC001719]
MNARATASRVRDLYWPPLVAAVADLANRRPELGLIVGYHLGLNDAGGVPGAGDDGLASTLCLAGLGARAVGADEGQAAACAVATELVKDFIQLQDDILDEDDMRRGRPSAWRAFGIPATLLAADAARAQALEIISAVEPHGLAAMRHLARGMDAVTHGQAADLAAESRPYLGEGHVTLAEYDRTIEDKGAGIVITALALGAVLTGAPTGLLDALTRCGRSLGMAWQILDDITDIWQPSGPRAFSSDLRRSKKSYPVIAALASEASERPVLASLLAARPTTAAGVREAAELIEACGGRRIAEMRMSGLYTDALDTLTHPGLDQAAVADISAIAALLGTRGTDPALTVGTPGH